MMRLIAILVVLGIALGGHPLLLAMPGPCGCHRTAPSATSAPLTNQSHLHAVATASSHQPAPGTACCAGCITTSLPSKTDLAGTDRSSTTTDNSNNTNNNDRPPHTPCQDCDCPLPCCGVVKAPVATVEPAPGRIIVAALPAPPATEQHLRAHGHLDELCRPPRHPASI
ncbi:MAG: hypothetical protein ACTS3F_01690 [Phycisphaerales bacterium]